MITLTPLYDGLLAEALSRARSSEATAVRAAAAAARAAAAAALHTGGPTGRCLGCGLAAPCPTAGLLAGSLTVEAARSAALQALLTLATAQRAELDRAVRTAVTAAEDAAAVRARAAAVQAAAAEDAAAQAAAAQAAASGDDRPQDAEGEVRALPAMPSAADIFAPNPAFDRALSVLLGGS